MRELPADPFASPLEGVPKRDPGQSADDQEKAPEGGIVLGAAKKLLRVRGEGFSRKTGTAGERIVGRSLDRHLDRRRWLVLHDLALNEAGANIDHLVIGSPGVFTISTKNHEGHKVRIGDRWVYVAGQPKDYLKKARWEAGQARRYLQAPDGESPEVTPVLAILADKIIVKDKPEGVEVLKARHLVKWLESQPPRLSDLEVLLLKHAAGDWARSIAQDS